MPEPEDLSNFFTGFFGLYTQRSFGGADFLTYIARPVGERSGDEASVVDTAIVGPILGLLGFEPGERTYNQQHLNERPDFAPRDAVYGTCFMVEDKNTTLDLQLDLIDPDSHLSQLSRYVRREGLRLGWLCNGHRLMVFSFDNPANPTPIIDLDIPAAINEWTSGGEASLSPQTKRALQDLYDKCSKASFTNPQRLEDEIAIDLVKWKLQALPLGKRDDGTLSDGENESVLVQALQTLVGELQRDARRTLDEHLRRYNEYKEKASKLNNNATRPAVQHLDEMRRDVAGLIASTRSASALDQDEIQTVDEKLLRAEHDATAYVGPGAVVAEILAIINAARHREHGGTRNGRAVSDLKAISTTLHTSMDNYLTAVFGWHQRQANLRQIYRDAIGVHDDYTLWTALVQETMLGGFNEEQRRNEFALQAAYVVFIRLLLIRVCEDKGIFEDRFLSDGGLQHWQEDIQRYLKFANGNPYSPLLDMAYRNAQNIYAHFFTGRELFNWYQLNKQQLVMTLHRLSRFDFAGVDSDIIGTIYSTYVTRKEKRERGQYYTPAKIVNYILDHVGYKAEAGILGDSKRLIDPACGSGSFLVAAARRLVDAYKGDSEQISEPVEVLRRVQQQLYGFDLNPFACYLAEVNLLIQVLDLVKLAHDQGRRTQLERFHIYNIDSLARPQGPYRFAMFGTLQAMENDVVDQIKSRAPGSPYVNGFGFVVANPPYGAKFSEAYKEKLRADWPEVFFGKPESYTFFMKLGLELLAADGRFGYITSNTYLTGTNTAPLREVLLQSGRIEQVVDLPQGIWEDATVDCVLLFLSADNDPARREAQVITVHLLDVRDTLDDLANEQWTEILEQPQAEWIADPDHTFNIRYNALSRQIEEACQTTNADGTTKVQVLDHVTESNQGIIVYETAAESKANLYIKPEVEVPHGEPEWKPLLDGDSYVGRYELRWDETHPHLKYGPWLCRPREAKFFDSPKLLLVRLMNKAIKRRLVATYDESGFYNRDNFNNIIARGDEYDLKYILALFNSSVLNYWYTRRFDNVNINPASIRKLPIHPADAQTQAEIAQQVGELLENHRKLNEYRKQGYTIKQRLGGDSVIDIPYDVLLEKLQTGTPPLATLDLYDAQTNRMFTLPARCSPATTVSSNVFLSPDRFPNAVILRHNQLWLEVPDEVLRRFLYGYLRRPRWKGMSWNELKSRAFIPQSATDLTTFFQAESHERGQVQTLLNDIARIDAEIDARVLDLYGITDVADRQRIIGDAPPVDEAEGADQSEEEESSGGDAMPAAVTTETETAVE